MSVIRTTWSKAYADNFNDIFRKKEEPKKEELVCTHADKTGKFCMKHQGGCGHHYNLQPDSKCECQPCDE